MKNVRLLILTKKKFAIFCLILTSCLVGGQTEVQTTIYEEVSNFIVASEKDQKSFDEGVLIWKKYKEKEADKEQQEVLAESEFQKNLRFFAWRLLSLSIIHSDSETASELIKWLQKNDSLVFNQFSELPE